LHHQISSRPSTTASSSPKSPALPCRLASPLADGFNGMFASVGQYSARSYTAITPSAAPAPSPWPIRRQRALHGEAPGAALPSTVRTPGAAPVLVVRGRGHRLIRPPRRRHHGHRRCGHRPLRTVRRPSSRNSVWCTREADLAQRASLLRSWYTHDPAQRARGRAPSARRRKSADSRLSSSNSVRAPVATTERTAELRRNGGDRRATGRRAHGALAELPCTNPRATENSGRRKETAFTLWSITMDAGGERCCGGRVHRRSLPCLVGRPMLWETDLGILTGPYRFVAYPWLSSFFNHGCAFTADSHAAGRVIFLPRASTIEPSHLTIRH
jgi:hypothetical protein